MEDKEESMKQLTLTLPGGNTINPPADLKTPSGGKFTDLASVITPAVEVIFYVATFLAFYYLVWGALMYLLAKGEKEGLAKARAKITWALVGLVVIFLAFMAARYAGIVFTPDKGGLPF